MKGLAVTSMVGDDAKSAAKTVSADADSGCKKSRTHNECCDVQALALIESALLRLETGTYGGCLSCGEKISLARLDKTRRQKPVISAMRDRCLKQIKRLYEIRLKIGRGFQADRQPYPTFIQTHLLLLFFGEGAVGSRAWMTSK